MLVKRQDFVFTMLVISQIILLLNFSFKIYQIHLFLLHLHSSVPIREQAKTILLEAGDPYRTNWVGHVTSVALPSLDTPHLP